MPPVLSSPVFINPCCLFVAVFLSFAFVVRLFFCLSVCLALCCCITLSVSLNIIEDSDGDSVTCTFLLHFLVAIFEFEQEEYFVNETEILLVCVVLTNDVVIANQIILSMSSMDGSATGTYVTSLLYV